MKLKVLFGKMFGSSSIKTTKKNKKQQTLPALFLELAGEIRDGKSRWVTISEMRGKYARLISRNGNDFQRSIKRHYGHTVETVYNAGNVYPEYHFNKAIAWRINDNIVG